GIRDGHVTGVQTCALPILLQLFVALCCEDDFLQSGLLPPETGGNGSRGGKGAARPAGYHPRMPANLHESWSIGDVEIPSRLVLRSEERRVGKEGRSRLAGP